MEQEKNKKRLTIIMLVAAVISVIGATYAIWTYTFAGSASTITTPNIELELLESTDEIINISNALPMSDTQGIGQEKTFNFAVTTETSGTIDVGYSLKIEKLTVDNGYTALNDNQIKVYLTDYNNTQLLAPTLIDDLNNYVLYGKTNSHNSTTTKIQDKYKLRAWIDEDVLVNDWNENTRLQYKFKIGVTEKQETSASNAVYSIGSTSSVSLGATKDSISGYTTDYKTLNKTFFLKHNIGSNNTVESNEVCYILNETMYCLTGGDEGASYETNKTTLLESFGEDNCSVYSNGVDCSASGLYAFAYDDGFVRAYADIGGCRVDGVGDAYCDG